LFAILSGFIKNWQSTIYEVWGTVSWFITIKSLKCKKPSSLVIHIFKKYSSAFFGIFHWDKTLENQL
jgi:hypothetical protein